MANALHYGDKLDVYRTDARNSSIELNYHDAEQDAPTVSPGESH